MQRQLQLVTQISAIAEKFAGQHTNSQFPANVQELVNNSFALLQETKLLFDKLHVGHDLLDVHNISVAPSTTRVDIETEPVESEIRSNVNGTNTNPTGFPAWLLYGDATEVHT